MKIYSHSKLSTFEQCKLKYKFKYIDKIVPEIAKSIEAHLGSCVHLTLEWLYKQVQQNKIPSIDEMIVHYAETWQKEYSPEIVIVQKNLTERDYLEKGMKFLLDYYNKNKPFDDNTLELEKKIFIDFDDEDEIKIIGYIDRLVHNLKTGHFEIHDYKTANSQPPSNHGEKDRQLALYAIAIKESFGFDKEVKLIWHFLAHNRKIISKRTNEQLKQLKQETLNLIKEIENTHEFPPTKSALCQWCEFRDICPAWGNAPSKYTRTKQSTLGDFSKKKFIED